MGFFFNLVFPESKEYRACGCWRLLSTGEFSVCSSLPGHALLRVLAFFSQSRSVTDLQLLTPGFTVLRVLSYRTRISRTDDVGGSLVEPFPEWQISHGWKHLTAFIST